MTNSVNVSGDSTVNRITVHTTSSSGSVDTTNDASKFYSDLAKKWAISETLVDNTDYSSKYYAEKSKEYKEEVEAIASDVITEAVEVITEGVEQAQTYASNASDSADLARYYAEEASTGMSWLEINQEDWSFYSGNLYEYVFSGTIAISGVYEGAWANKKLIDVNIKSTDNSTSIYYTEPINGYVLYTNAVVTQDFESMVTNVIPDGNITVARDGKNVTIGTKLYVHNQSVASSVWNIAHNLNKLCPTIKLIDTSGAVFYPSVNYIDNNNCQVNLIGAMAGVAYCE